MWHVKSSIFLYFVFFIHNLIYSAELVSEHFTFFFLWRLIPQLPSLNVLLDYVACIILIYQQNLKIKVWGQKYGVPFQRRGRGRGKPLKGWKVTLLPLQIPCVYDYVHVSFVLLPSIMREKGRPKVKLITTNKTCPA